MAAPRPRQVLLTLETRHRLVSLARAALAAELSGHVENEWDVLLADISSYRFVHDFEVRSRKELLALFVDATLDGHRERWNKRIGELACALGLGTAPGQTAEQALAHWKPTLRYVADEKLGQLEEEEQHEHWDQRMEQFGAIRELARMNAIENLIKASKKVGGLKNPKFNAELCAVGWREAYTNVIEHAAQSDPDQFFGLLALAPDPAGKQTEALHRRMTRIRELADDAGGLDALGARLRNVATGDNGQPATMGLRLFQTYAALQTGGPNNSLGRDVDAVLILLGLLAGPRGLTGRDWLALKVLARDGMVCAGCELPLSSELPPVLHQVRAPRGRGAQREQDNYTLHCLPCEEEAEETAAAAPPAAAQALAAVAV